ncbi:MAG: hypothetical protein ACREMQ_16730, partial [Longimicrobiales bacterium]
MNTRTLRFRRTATALMLFGPTALGAQAPPSAPPQGPHEVVVRGGWLFDGIRESRVRNTGIVIQNGKFIEVGANLAGRDLSRAQVIDLDDNVTILPGMFDLHAHYNVNLDRSGRR